MVEIRNLYFFYKKNRPLFRGLNLDLHAGKTYGLFGLNGAGKTTLLNHLAGMLFPKKGECRILGQPADARLPEVMKELFFLPEEFNLPKIKPGSYTHLHAPFYPRFDKERHLELLNQFEIDTEKNLTELSYGQRKKFLIAFGLAANTRILLMDEPTNGLDIPSKSQFRRAMVLLNTKDRCTLISTHQVRDLHAIINQVTVLKEGMIIFDQSIDSISEALAFGNIRDGEPGEQIYREEIPGGEAVIFRRKDHARQTEIDLELLFNGIVTETDRINSVFMNSPCPD